jgi:hypothetical protein
VHKQLKFGCRRCQYEEAAEDNCVYRNSLVRTVTYVRVVCVRRGWRLVAVGCRRVGDCSSRVARRGVVAVAGVRAWPLCCRV